MNNVREIMSHLSPAAQSKCQQVEKRFQHECIVDAPYRWRQETLYHCEEVRTSHAANLVYLKLDGPINTVDAALSKHPLSHVCMLELLTCMLDVFSPSNYAHIGRMDSLTTLVIEGTRVNLSELSQVLKTSHVEALTLEVPERIGELCLPNLRHLELKVHSPDTLTVDPWPWMMCAPNTIPMLRTFVLTYTTHSYYSNNERLNCYLRHFVRWTPRLQSLTIRNKSHPSNGISVGIDLQLGLARLAELNHLSIGGFLTPPGKNWRPLEALLMLECQYINVEQIQRITPNLTSLDWGTDHSLWGRCQQREADMSRLLPQLTTLIAPDITLCGNLQKVKHIGVYLHLDHDKDEYLHANPRFFNKFERLQTITLNIDPKFVETTRSHFVTRVHLWALNQAQGLNRVCLVTCDVDPNITNVLITMTRITSICFRKCKLTAPLVTRMIEHMPVLLNMELAGCRGITPLECASIQATNAGSLGFRLLCEKPWKG